MGATGKREGLSDGRQAKVSADEVAADRGSSPDRTPRASAIGAWEGSRSRLRDEDPEGPEAAGMESAAIKPPDTLRVEAESQAKPLSWKISRGGS